MVFRMFAGLLVLLVTVVSALAGPQLIIPQEQFDFGFTPQHSSVSHTYWLKAGGDDSLRIVRVKPSCGCTKAPIARSVLAPGESTQVEIIFSTASYTGNLMKSTQIMTTEGMEMRSLHFRSNIVTKPDSTYPLVIKPYSLDFSPSPGEARTELSFSVTNLSDGPLRLKLVSTSEELFDVVLPEQVEAGQSAQGSVKLKPSTTGPVEKSFTIEVNDANSTHFTVPVKRVVVGGTAPAQSSSGH